MNAYPINILCTMADALIEARLCASLDAFARYHNQITVPVFTKMRSEMANGVWYPEDLYIRRLHAQPVPVTHSADSVFFTDAIGKEGVFDIDPTLNRYKMLLPTIFARRIQQVINFDLVSKVTVLVANTDNTHTKFMLIVVLSCDRQPVAIEGVPEITEKLAAL